MSRHPWERRHSICLSLWAEAAIVVVTLIILTGCQGLSSASSSKPQPSSGDLQLGGSSLAFGNVVMGSGKTLTVTATNTGSAAVTITGAAPTAKQFSLSKPGLPLTIAAGGNATLSITFSPSAAGTASGAMSISSDAANGTLTLGLNGTGMAPGQLTATPASINFSTVVIGNSQTKSAALTNTGGSSLTVSQATVTGAGFSLTGLSLPLTLAAGQSANVNVSFAPQSAGTASGNIAFASDASNTTLELPLSGDGAAPGVLTLSPTSMAFGSVLDGSNQKLSGTLTNTGGSDVNVSQAIVTGAGLSLSGLTLPLTLTAGQSAGFSVTFAPQSAGSVTGNVAIVSDASDSTVSLALSGTGLAPGSLAANPSSIDFGNVRLGSNPSVLESLTNSSGSSVTVTQVAPSGSGFSINGLSLPVTLTAGQSTSFNVVFAPSSAGPASGNLTITSNASNPTLTVPLTGSGFTPGTLTPNPSSLSFGTVQVGNNLSLSETLKNTGPSSVNISQDTVSGTGFSVSGFSPPITLTPGQSYTFHVIFAPQSAGIVNGNLTTTSDASNPSLAIPLSGTGSAPGTLAVSPTTLNFGNVVVGTNASLPGSLQASSASVIVTSANSTSSEFVLSGISFPVTIPAGNSAGFTVKFTPQATGTVNATLSFASNASNSPTVQSLTGKGTAPHSVLLSWTASNSPNLTGYNVYRSTTSGSSYSKINSSLNSTTSYTDSSVVDGTTYYYVTRAVNSGGQESVNSNQATAPIPPP